ncbi:hypothetical protein MRB53_000621 [Persea americana]|uniref:Uncharacterized protein n=1 Tax=Persea americana TaxID=3435 RepID=A0ACC2MQ17_PERAE|nr:hypothetical protein MRB53_000621 [Persea americana]
MRFPLPPSSLLIVSLFLSIFFFFCSYPTSAQCLDDQKSSLLTLFGTAHPPPSWTPNTDCCIHWEGITCNDSTGHVTGLGLPNRSINASINFTSLISLSSLRNLDLSNNSFFNSSIPTSIGALSNLTHLNLSNSGFTGYVPVEISRIKSLESLDLSSTFLRSLSSLRFSSHDFEFVVGNLSGLRELYLDGVNISSPAPKSLAGLANLRSLHLNSCNLTGDFPVLMFRLRNLETLDLSNNLHLKGSLPEFPQESRLQILSLSGTNFSGRLPSSFGNLRHLQRLELKGCKFSEGIPSSLGSISQLVHLDISHNSFSGLGWGFGMGIGMVFGPLVFWRNGRRWYNKHVDRMLFMVMPTRAWFFTDSLLEMIGEEETLEQELMEFTSDDVEEEEERELLRRHFCVFCTKIDMGWKWAIHRECSCPDASPLFSSQGSQNAEETVR